MTETSEEQAHDDESKDAESKDAESKGETTTNGSAKANGSAKNDASGVMVDLYELRTVERRYSHGGVDVLALKSIDLDIKAGEFMSIEGPSGSGKSTLLQLLGALDSPTGGTIRFDGRELGRAPDKELTAIRSAQIGFVFQQFNLIPTLTRPRTWASPWHRTTPLEPSATSTRRAARSGRPGPQTRSTCRHDCPVASSSASLLPAPWPTARVIIADEPTGNLDSESAGEVMGLLAGLQEASTVTVIVATHDPDVANSAAAAFACATARSPTTPWRPLPPDAGRISSR